MEYHKVYLTRLKTILQSNLFYLIITFVLIGYVILFTKVIKYTSVYDDETEFTGVVSRYIQKDGNTTIYLDSKQKIIVSIYENVDINVGDKVKITGKVSDILPNTIPNTFNYKKYLYNNHIYTKVVGDKITIMSHSTNPLTKIKNLVINRCKNNTYLMLFICGDKTGMDTSIYNNFKKCGIAHLLAISGMHVSIFILILNKLLFFLNKNLKNIIMILFLIFYSYLVNFTPSILRVVISFIIGVILSYSSIRISPVKKLLLTAFIIILIDPFNVYSTSFQYSFSASLGVISTQNHQKKNYLLNIIIISFYTLLFTLPITVNLNYECNLILFISNLLFIPYVSLFLYPLGLLTFIFPFLSNIFSFFTSLMEKGIAMINKIDIFIINIPKMPIYIIVLFYILLLSFLFYNKKQLLYMLISLVILVKVGAFLDFNDYVIFFDVGQGDCAAIISKFHKDVVLIDTGGLRNYTVSDNVILYFKSIGITKIDTLLLTHGDYDHMGDAENVINNMKVKKVILNKGNNNDLENSLIDLLNKKHIEYSHDASTIEIENASVYSLNNGVYKDENNSSNVLLIQMDNKNLLFMGDAEKEAEENILANYDLPKIDILKVGHHGSNTSSSKDFINKIEPGYAIISVGRNNRYHHPNKEVLDTLRGSVIYRTDQDGSVIFKIKDDNFTIMTYAT